MKQTTVLIVVALMVSVGFLCGCNEITGIDIEENIKGQWYARQGNTTYSFTFYNDGTCKYSVGFYLMGVYYVVGDKLECHFEDVTWVGDFQNFYDIEMPDKDTLILTTRGSGKATHDGRLEYTRLN